MDLDDPRHHRADLGEGVAEVRGARPARVASSPRAAASVYWRVSTSCCMCAVRTNSRSGLSPLGHDRHRLAGHVEARVVGEGEVDEAAAVGAGGEQPGAHRRRLVRAGVLDPVAAAAGPSGRRRRRRARRPTPRGSPRRARSDSSGIHDSACSRCSSASAGPADGEVGAGGVAGRAHRGREVTGGGGVPGQLGRGAERGIGSQRTGIRAVEAEPLTRQEVVGDRLTEERVAEGVGRRPARLDDVVLDRVGDARPRARPR